MENILYQIGQVLLYIIVGGLILILNIYRFQSTISQGIPSLYRILPRRRIKECYKIHLARNINFYKNLDQKSKIEFEKRVQQFISMKQFISRSKGLEITCEITAIVAGTAVMVTWGFPYVYLSHFKKILIYNDNYYSTITQQYHKGEVHPGGIIVLSWAALKEGFVDREDGINLGIHEMAHALKIENRVRNEEYSFIEQKAINKFDELADLEIYQRADGPEGRYLLRDYSITNRQEYFAVAVEWFFENPGKLKEIKPELFDSLVTLLKVNPLSFQAHKAA